MNEADTCRKYVVPKLTEAGWDDAPHFIAEQRNFTDGRVILAGELLARLKARQGLDDGQTDRLLAPYNLQNGRTPRYYQTVAIHRTIQAILTGKKRVLLTMATGTGKTTTAFQICWKLWSGRWNLSGEHRRPKILYLADRNVLKLRPISEQGNVTEIIGFFGGADALRAAVNELQEALYAA